MGTVSRFTRERTIRGWQGTFREIYHLRNLWSSSPSRIVLQIGRELRIINQCADKGFPLDEKALAGLGARLFALANFLDEDLAALLTRKYHGRCPYCGADVDCDCGKEPGATREKVFADPERAEAMAGSLLLDEAQRMLARIYGKRNEAAGVKAVFGRTNGEFLELNEAIANLDVEGFREEIADVFAWWLGLVTLAGRASASDLLYSVYPDACSRCGQNPCPIRGPCPPL